MDQNLLVLVPKHEEKISEDHAIFLQILLTEIRDFDVEIVDLITLFEVDILVIFDDCL